MIKNKSFVSLCLMVALGLGATVQPFVTQAQVVSTTTNVTNTDIGDVAPSNVGTSIPLTYQGPPPSEVDKKLVGPVLLLRAGKFDQKAGTITLPLYLGHMKDGKNVWYILTDTDDERNAEALGLNFSAKLSYSNVGSAVRSAHLQKDGSVMFDTGTVDFSPVRAVTPGDAPNAFPPKVNTPGSVGDATYTPFIKLENAGGHIYNAPVIASNVNASDISFCNGNVDYSKVHDRVMKICPNANGGGTVTLKTTPIFSFGKTAFYISMDASDPVPATLDNATLAPAMADLPIGGDDGAFSAVERLFVIANGPTGAKNPQRQGLNSALTDKDANGMPLPPLNLIGGIPTVALDYSPAWDLNLGEWTQEAISQGYRSRMIDEFQWLGMVQRGFITGPKGAKFGSTGIIVNCPIVARAI